MNSRFRFNEKRVPTKVLMQSAVDNFGIAPFEIETTLSELDYEWNVRSSGNNCLIQKQGKVDIE